MALDIIAIPNLAENIILIKQYTPMFFWVLGLSILFLIVFKLTTNRISVERLMPVSDGYVIRSGRYREGIDKETGLRFLQPMFGKERIPILPNHNYQKVDGLPFFGIEKHISLFYPDKYSTSISLPPKDRECIGRYNEFDARRWFFMDQRAKFIKKIKRGEIIRFLSIYAPLMVIVGAIIFWSVMIIIQASILNKVGADIDMIAISIVGIVG